MINEAVLRDALLALAQQSKTQYLMISATLAELASVRETVRGLDPTFADVLATKQKQYQEETREVVSNTVALLDQIIERLKRI
jgi:hypothetical protein